MQLEIRVDNAELIKSLGALAGELQVKAVRAGLREASKPIAEQMASLSPRRSRSRIAAAMNVTQFTKTMGEVLGVDARNLDTGAVALLIGPNKGGAKRWKLGVSVSLWREFGTKNVGKTAWMSRGLEAAGEIQEALFYRGLQSWLDRSAARGILS